MRRPHRTVRTRLQRRTTALGKRLPAGPRRRIRRIADRWGLTTSLRAVRRPFGRRDAEVVEAFDARQVIDELATQLRSALIDGGIELVHLQRDAQMLLVVPREQRSATLRLLHDAANAVHWWVQGPDGRPTRLGDPTGLRVRGDTLRVFRVLAAAHGDPFSGPEVGVDLQFWKTAAVGAGRPDGGRFPKGTRVAPNRNRMAPYLEPTQWRLAQQRPDRRLQPQPPPPLLTLVEPVDLVYTWVDASDPAWQQRRAAFQPATERLAADALDPSRTTNHDELRHSLRSVEMYANWVRHIWLVTDGQVPPWLVRDHPRLTLVSHRDIFTDPAALPTFNSHAIESQLHHIDGLAEHFLYLNDDVFFGRPVHPGLFFHGNGIAKFALSRFAIDHEPQPGALNGAMVAARNGRDFLERRLDRSVTHRMQHVPHAHLRSVLAEFESRYPDVVANVARSRFRSDGDVSIPSDLGHYYAYARGRAVTATFAFRYIDIGSPDVVEHLDSLLARREPDCFCLNDVGGYAEPVPEAPLVDFLDRYFPVPSSFESAEAA